MGESMETMYYLKPNVQWIQTLFTDEAAGKDFS
jgi:hypothetical protein